MDSGLGWIRAEVIDPRSGLVVTHDFHGAGNLVQISEIPQTNDSTMQVATVVLSLLSTANDVLRQYSARQARIEIYGGSPVSLAGAGGARAGPVLLVMSILCS